ncbi:MAG TPA: hypothetical protein EYG85_03525 [Crocinitomix sp.]|nr:hypothetical protein [Crocinitomix sp.]
MKTKTIKTKVMVGFLGLTLVMGFNSCNRKGCTDPLADNYNEKSKKDDGTCTYSANKTVELKFTHNFDGSSVTKNELNQMNYKNEMGDSLSFTRLRYSISDIRFYLPNGDSIYVNGSYHLVDITDDASLVYTLPSLQDFIVNKDYQAKFTGIGFNYGFDEEDNVSGAYTDLNAASWNWPDMIGGGYHQLQLEGIFKDNTGSYLSYQYHNGSATKDPSGNFEANYKFIKLSGSAFDLSAPTTVEIKMNLANWFRNPNTWDLNTYYTMLMPNYTAQKMITENSIDVFSVGTISQ